MNTSEGILIVDDDSNWQDTLSQLLRSEGYVVELADDYSKALDKIHKAESWLTAFDLSLCVVDLRFSGSSIIENFDGLGLLAVCKNIGLPAIVVSAYLKRGMKARFHEQYGVIATFDKEAFPEQEFLAVVKQALAPREDHTDHLTSRMGEVGKLEFRTKLQSLIDTVFDYYKKAHTIINDKQRERRIARGRSVAEDEDLWLKQLGELDQEYNSIMVRLSQVGTIVELDELHPQVLKDCLKWVIGSS